MGEEVKEAYRILVEKCRDKGIGVLGPVVPPTKENLEQAVRDGYTMIILGNDMSVSYTHLETQQRLHRPHLRAAGDQEEPV